jgi:hypothetical protein
MEIISRKLAKERKLNTYFTGEPCKHGHKSYRYTQSGGCFECINGGKSDPESPTIIARRERLELTALQIESVNEVTKQFIDINIVVHENDVDTVKALILGYAMVRNPLIVLEKIWISRKPKHNVVWKVKAHPDDVASIFEVTRVMFKVYQVDVEAARAQILGKAVASYVPPTEIEIIL